VKHEFWKLLSTFTADPVSGSIQNNIKLHKYIIHSQMSLLSSIFSFILIMHMHKIVVSLKFTMNSELPINW
jgi:hypothetical protein